jgi:hypothetical protein
MQGINNLLLLLLLLLPLCLCVLYLCLFAVTDYSSGVEGFTYNYYEDLTTGDVKGIVDTLRKGGKPKVRAREPVAVSGVALPICASCVRRAI